MDRSTTNRREREREEITGMLESIVKKHKRMVTANAYNRPDGFQSNRSLELTDRLFSIANKFDVSLQIDARGDQALTAGLQRFRQSSDHLRDLILWDHRTFDACALDNGDDDEDQDGNNGTYNDLQHAPTLPSQHDAADLLTSHSLQRPLTIDTDNTTNGMPLFKYLDASHAHCLLGFPKDFWPRINKIDHIYSDKSNKIPIVLRDHCRLAVAEIISKAFEQSPPGMPDTYSYKSGCVLTDGTGLGKTCQATMLVGALSYIMTELELRKDEEGEGPNGLRVTRHFPAVMLRDRSDLLDALATDAQKKIDPEETIRRVRRQAHDNALNAQQSKLSWGFYGRNQYQHVPSNAPSIIIAPPQLMQHWRTELRRFSSDHLIVIEIVDAELAHRLLSPLHQSLLDWEDAKDRSRLIPPSDFIVLCSTSVLLRCRQRGYRHTPDLPDRTFNPSRPWNGQEGVYGIRYTLAIFDEVHLVKGRGKLHEATHALGRRCLFFVGQTATPMMNTPLDLCFIASALNLPHARNIAYGDPKEEPGYFQQLRRAVGHQRKFDAQETTTLAKKCLYRADAHQEDRLPAYVIAPPTPGLAADHIREQVGHPMQLERNY